MNFSWNLRAPEAHLWRSALITAGQLAVLMIAVTLLTDGFYALLREGGLGPSEYLTHATVLRAMASDSSVLARTAALALPPLLLFRRTRWTDLGLPRALRLIPAVAGGIIVWVLVTAEPNFWSGFSRVADHFVLIALYFAMIRHPAFSGAFCALAFCLFNELNYPIGHFWISEKGAVLDQIIVLQAYVLTVGLTGKASVQIYVFLTFAVQIENYFWSGIRKIELGDHALDWVLNNRTADLILMHSARGHSLVDTDFIVRHVELLNSLYVVPNGVVLGAQLASILYLVSQRFFAGLMAFTIILHSVIFLATGILFWEWIILSLTFEAFLIVAVRRGLAPSIFNLRNAMVGVLMVATAPYWHKPHYLGWFDRPVDLELRIFAVDGRGDRRLIPPNAFAPYDRRFNYPSDFLFLTDTPIISGWNFDRTTVRDVQQLSADDFLLYQAEHGESHIDPGKITVLDEFIRRYFENADMPGGPIRSIIPAAPLHLFLTPSAAPIIGPETLNPSRVDIYLRQWGYFERQLIILKDDLVHSVDVNRD